MDENSETQSQSDSPKPLAFTIDFDEGKSVDTERHKALVERYQKRHRRGQSLSKLDDSPSTPVQARRAPSTGGMPRKSSLQSSEGYFSSDERNESRRNGSRPSSAKTRGELTLPLRGVMAMSYPSGALPSISSPEVELRDIDKPELVGSPDEFKEVASGDDVMKVEKQCSSSESEENRLDQSSDVFVDGTEFNFDKSDTVSDAGTYTIEVDNYSQEQKARMSIDKEFQIEEVSVLQKTQEYVLSLNGSKKSAVSRQKSQPKPSEIKTPAAATESKSPLPSPSTPGTFPFEVSGRGVFTVSGTRKGLSPILSPTQNLSITNNLSEERKVKSGKEEDGTTFTKIMFPSSKARSGQGLGEALDQGSIISVTSSGAFRVERERRRLSQLCLSKSEVHVEAYTGESVVVSSPKVRMRGVNLTTNIVNVQSICIKDESGGRKDDKVVKLPPSGSGKSSPSKIPSPVHSARPRSRNSISSLNVDLSDSSLETESYLKPTQNYILALERKIPSDSDREYDYNNKYKPLNNDTANLLKQKLTHVRHNSFDDRNLKVQNKLEHFQNKNLQSIDQTPKLLNQYDNKIIHKIQNSPNNSPIRRSSSFSAKNQVTLKTTNLQKQSNIRDSPNFTRNGSIQRSASTASIKPRLPLGVTDRKIDRSQFADTESSSEEDFEQILQIKRDVPNLTNTKYNRAFALRRARLDEPPQAPPKCPNTPEMRRKFQPDHARAISMDRKLPNKTNDVQSRYLLNLSKKVAQKTEAKVSPKVPASKGPVGKVQAFSRTDSGRFSMRSPSAVNKTPASGQKSLKKDAAKKSSNNRSNSSLSSREVEFQMWKRRKSYDPMKAAAEGKRKAEMAKKQSAMVQSCYESNQNQDCDSSPSHSSSVHRSQSFHGTAALEQLVSSDEDDYTLSADEGFSPPTPSPCELSPARAGIRHVWKEQRLPY